MNNVDVNVDNYTVNDLLNIVDLTGIASDDQITNVFTQYIRKYIRDKNYKIAQFFHDAKEKILDERKKDKSVFKCYN